MGLFEVNSTITKVTTAPGHDLEASFGLAALKLLEEGDRKSLKELMDLRERVRDACGELDALMEKAGAA